MGNIQISTLSCLEHRAQQIWGRKRKGNLEHIAYYKQKNSIKWLIIVFFVKTRKEKKKKNNSIIFSLCPLPVHKLNQTASDPIFRWISVSFNILSKHSPRKTVRPILPETVSSRTKESHSPEWRPVDGKRSSNATCTNLSRYAIKQENTRLHFSRSLKITKEHSLFLDI